MSIVFICPNCKDNLDSKPDGFQCNRCSTYFRNKNGYIDFIPNLDFYAGEIPKTEMKDLLLNIDKLGYSNALDLFFKKFPALQPYLFDNKRIDWLYHALGHNTKNCLDIGSGLGNLSEKLSDIYDNVYSVEAVAERIEFQKRRFHISNKSNIIISRCNAFKLPFKDDSFDLIVCNGVLEWIGMINKNLHPRDAQIAFLKELKRVLNKNGCLYIGIENRTGFQFLLGGIDHSGLPYTSLMPRWLANLMVKRFGKAGGIYGDEYKGKKETNGYHTYTYTIYGYRSLFKEAGFNTNSFWVFPSYNQPYYTGNTENKYTIRGLVSYIKASANKNSFRTRYKFASIMIYILPPSISKFFTNLLSPSFLFYCFKSDFQETIDTIISNKLNNNNQITISEGSDLKFLIFNSHGKPLNLVHVRRILKEIPAKILTHDKTNPDDLPNHGEKIWIEEWIYGQKMDPNNKLEIASAVNWLMEFQLRTQRNDVPVKEFIRQEIENLNSIVAEIPEVDCAKSMIITDKYRSFLMNSDIKIVAEHGDYWFGNILFDNRSGEKLLSVIDWEYYRPAGDPFFDLVFFVLNISLAHGNSIGDILHDSAIDVYFKPLEPLLNKHFAFKIDFDIIIPYVLLRFAIRKRIEKGPYNSEWIRYSNALGILRYQSKKENEQ